MNLYCSVAVVLSSKTEVDFHVYLRLVLRQVQLSGKFRETYVEEYGMFTLSG